MYFRFPAVIGEQMPVSWCHGLSPGADCSTTVLQYHCTMYLSVIALLVLATTVENTSYWCYPSPPCAIVQSQVLIFVLISCNLHYATIFPKSDHHLEKTSAKTTNSLGNVSTFRVDFFGFASWLSFFQQIVTCWDGAILLSSPEDPFHL